jgi:transcriptional regulator with XRE-family HTH domain
VKCDDIGKRLSTARERTGLSRRRVSLDAGLAPEAVHSIEHTSRMPGIDTTERLANVLGVSAAWLAYGVEPLRRIYNFRIAPSFNGMARAAELDATLRGAGGRIDQSFLYSDALGAHRYMEIAQNYRGLPVKHAATSILAQTQDALTVVALGSGHARHETALVEHLVRPGLSDVAGEPSIELYLIDASVCMISEGYRYASEQLGRHGIPITAIEGDFIRLPTFSDCFSSRGPRRKLFTLLGFTVGNLDNEITFLRESLMGAVRGDFLLVDYLVADRSFANIEEVIANDPVSRILASGGTITTSRFLAFLAGPVSRHYGEDVLTLSLRGEKESGAIPQSYSVEVWVTARTRHGEKRFMTVSLRRYEGTEFVQAFARNGWTLVQEWPFGPDRPSSLALFQRGGS